MQPFDIFFLAACLVFIVAIFASHSVAVVYSSKLMSYLRRFMPDKYNCLTITMLWGLKAVNPIAGLRYVFSRSEIDDRVIARYKELVKGGLLGSLTSSAALLVMLLMRLIWELLR